MRPKKQQIIDDLTAAIASGRIMAGQPLPTTPTLQARYAASIPTVRAAVAHLKAVGLVEFVPGVGIMVRQTKKEGSPTQTD